jgi:CsoR family transcriptional regulator, copper-sensing transcriptional repressor
MIPIELTDLAKDIKTRLATIKGQVEGISNMIDAGKDPESILVQFKSLDKGLQKARHLLLDEVFRKSLALKIVQTVDACPGDCGKEEKIERILKEFPDLSLEEVTTKIKEISELEAFVKNARPSV